MNSPETPTASEPLTVNGPVPQVAKSPVVKLVQSSERLETRKFDQLGLDRKFHQAAMSKRPVDQFLRDIATIINEFSENLALWISKRDASGQFSQIHAISDENADAVWQLVEPECRPLIEHISKTKSVSSCSVKKYLDHQVVATPVIVDQVAEYAVIGCFSTKSQTSTRQQWLMGMVGQSFASWIQQRNLEQAEIKTRSLNDALTLIQNLDQTTDVHAASMVVVNHLRRLCDSEQVVISYCSRPGTGELTAISDVERIESGSESNKLIQHACNQAIVENKALKYPSADELPDSALLPLEQYCKANRLAGCINQPLVSPDGKVLGAILVALNEKQVKQPEFTEYLSQMGTMIAGHLEIVIRANRGLFELTKTSLKKLRTARWTKPVLATLAVSFAALCVPMPYRIPCDCELQPVMRRFVAAPYEGILEKTLVQNGDIVQKGQVLASMDGRQLRIELAGLRAEHAGAKKRCDSALAKSDYASSQISRSEMKRLQSKIDLLEQRVVNLEIKSPIDGVIVSGDLEKVEGAPMELGQTLFEVGPLDQMLAEVAIPESEIRYVEPGMDVAIKLNSFPYKNWHGEIVKVHPRTEVVNDESVFVAQVQMPNPELLLRPGLKGTAKVRSRSYPLGWNLFHHAWESVRYWMIW